MNKIIGLYLQALNTSIVVFIFSTSIVYAGVGGEGKKPISSVTYDHVLNWSLGLVFVLGLFIACIWFMQKMGKLPINSREKMKVVAGISLGGREKLVLVQIGEKQMVLGVSPGRVNNLLVLEGEDCMLQESSDKKAEGEFAKNLKQIMAGSLNE
ncbi:MAG: flagellar biosynthetic protein FliO [Methylococcales bacterium]|nr:flagellar biosynthetic protein FliO [Methylococcales bacterium]